MADDLPGNEQLALPRVGLVGAPPETAAHRREHQSFVHPKVLAVGGRLVVDDLRLLSVERDAGAGRLCRALAMTSPPPPRGSYGYRIDGPEDAACRLVRVPAAWPRISLRVGPRDRRPVSFRMTESRASVPLAGGGRLDVAEATRHASLELPDPARVADRLHAGLARLAAVVSFWDGRETFHGAGVVVDGVAWAVAGEREAGKSSLMGFLANQGLDILADDMVAVDPGGPTAFAGPRCLDLRPGTPLGLDALEPASPSRAGERLRVRLPDVEASFPFGGWVFLEWGAYAGVERVPPAERIRRLADLRTFDVPPKVPASLVDLGALPAWVLTRPREWAAMPEAAERLLALIGS